MKVVTFLVSVPGCVARRRTSAAVAARSWCRTRRVELARGTSRGRVLGGASSFSSGLRRAGAIAGGVSWFGAASRDAAAGGPRAAARLRVRACAVPARRADRLRITAKHDQPSLEAGAVATATGTVARPAEDTTLPLDLYTGRVLLTALPRTRHCPRSAPRPDPPHSTDYYFYETHFSQVLAIADASEVARKLRLCGYLTARRRTPSGVRTVTVARASTTVTGPAPQSSDSDEPTLGRRILNQVVGWMMLIGITVGLIKLGKWWIHDTPAARKARRAATARRLRRLGRSSPAPPPAPPAPSYAVPASPPPQSAPMAPPPQPAPVQTERPRRRAKPRDVVLDAVDAVADTYRDRLQNILEHQDGPGWLDAFNHRRAASFIQDGKPRAAAIRLA